MSIVDSDNSNISPGARQRQAAALGYLLGVPLPVRRSGAAPISPEQPPRLGEPIQPKITLGERPASMGPAPATSTASPLNSTLGANASSAPPLPASLGGATGLPPIARPTPEESAAAGRREYAEGLPQVTAAPNTADFYNQQAARLEYQKEHPWGSPVSSHPGALGKIGHTLATIGNVVGDVLEPKAMAIIPGTQLNREIQLGNAEKLGQQAAQAEQQHRLGEARLGEIQAQTNAANTRQALDRQRLEKLKQAPGDKMLTHGVDENGNAVVTFKRPDGSVYTVPAGYKAQTKGAERKPFTNPFEAFAYGSPAEKKAAQNFLALEKRTGAQYRQPSEIDEKYRLYKQDPKAYAAMFGTKGAGGISQATATKMLNYFQRRRKEIPAELGISPYVPPTPQQQAELKQKLAEINALERPFMEAARGIQPGKGNASQGGDTVVVINPQGVKGTIPRANLKRALSRGYKVANQ